jgi:hypothetical protein
MDKSSAAEKVGNQPDRLAVRPGGEAAYSSVASKVLQSSGLPVS